MKTNKTKRVTVWSSDYCSDYMVVYKVMAKKNGEWTCWGVYADERKAKEHVETFLKAGIFEQGHVAFDRVFF